MNKTFSEIISITIDLMLPLKVLVINKSKDTHHKSVIAHLGFQSFLLDLIPRLWPFFVDFQSEAVTL